MNNLAIYTTYCGPNKSATFNTTTIDSKYPHYFISNNKEILSLAQQGGWKPIYLDIPVVDNFTISSEQAKIAKAMPQVFSELVKYRWLVYKDDKIVFDYSKLNIYLDNMEKAKAAIGLRSYPAHVNFPNNILYEFAEAMLQARYYNQRDRIIKYITNQIKLGNELDNQLYWTSFIIRDQYNSLTNKFNIDWFDGIQQCGAECQISFDFTAANYKENIFILPQSI